MEWNNKFIAHITAHKKIAIAGGLGLLILVAFILMPTHTPPKTTNASSSILLNNQQNALEQFNQSVQITPLSYALYKDKQQKEMLALKYHLINNSNTPISQIKWYSVISLGKQLYDIFAIQTPLKLAPNAQTHLIYHLPLSSLSPTLQQTIKTDPHHPLSLTSIAGELEWDNQQKIHVTDEEILKKELNLLFTPTP